MKMVLSRPIQENVHLACKILDRIIRIMPLEGHCNSLRHSLHTVF